MKRQQAYAHQEETLDAFALRIYGRTQGITERLLNVNGKALCVMPFLPTDKKIRLLLPSEMPTIAEKLMIKLWD